MLSVLRGRRRYVQTLRFLYRASSRGLKPRLSKLDIEGEEYSAMRDMSEVLRGCDPILFVEFNPRALQRDDIPPVVYRVGGDAARGCWPRAGTL